MILAVCALALVTAFSTAGDAGASRGMLIGIFDEGTTLFAEDAVAFEQLETLNAQVLRIGLAWDRVVKTRPARATDPDDEAYSWRAYDRVVNLAKQHGVRILFSIHGTPRWSSGSRFRNRAPKRFLDLRNFAYAAAKRYSGVHQIEEKDDDGKVTKRILGPVKLWLAWNEPNNPLFLQPQYTFKRVRVRVRTKSGRIRVVTRKRWTVASAVAYTKICNAVMSGVHGTLLAGEKVGCGATAPRGALGPGGSRQSVSPLLFLRSLRKAGLKKFDAYAHHPYPGRPSEKPTTRTRSKASVTFGNLDVLIKELTRLYGKKKLWITEYAYQTRPPDPFFGVSPTLQARYLTQAFAIARRNPRIDMMLWFLLRDEPRLPGRDGWQSGLETVGGVKKPAFDAFRRLRD